MGSAPPAAWSVVSVVRDAWGVNWSGLVWSAFPLHSTVFFLAFHVDVQDQLVNIAPLDHLLHLHFLTILLCHLGDGKAALGGGASAWGAGNSGNVIYNE